LQSLQLLYLRNAPVSSARHMKNIAGKRVNTKAPPKTSGIDSKNNIEELMTKRIGWLPEIPNTPSPAPRRIPPWIIASRATISGIVSDVAPAEEHGPPVETVMLPPFTAPHVKQGLTRSTTSPTIDVTASIPIGRMAASARMTNFLCESPCMENICAHAW